MKKFRMIICFVLAAAMLLSVTGSLACTTIAVGKDASVDGSTMISHSVDGWYDERIEIVPGGHHEPGEVVEIYRDPCMDGYRPVSKVGEVPQVEETFTYFDTGYPFMNEKGITIGEHTWSGNYTDYYCDGALFVIANLQALGLQRASTARECVEIMGALAEEYGYADGGETLLVGDKDEIWIFEIAGPGPLWEYGCGKPGAHWGAKRVPDDSIHAGANNSVLKVIDFTDTEHKNNLWSNGITEYPKELGYWKEGEEFNFSKIFDTAIGNTSYTCSGRVWRIYDTFAPSGNYPLCNTEQALTALPFSIKPDQKISLQNIFDIYCDHYEGADFDMTVGLAAGPWGSPVRYSLKSGQAPEAAKKWSWERAIGIARCSYGLVSQMRQDMPAEIGTVLWYWDDDPTTTVHVPIYAGTTEVPDAWKNSNRWEFDPTCAWWAFNFVNNWATRCWNVIYPEICEKRDAMQGKFMAEMPDVEAEATALYTAGDVEGAKKVLTDYVCNTMNYTFDEWWSFAWHLVGKYYDGNVYDAENKTSTAWGYPTEYLEAIGYGQNMQAVADQIGK